MSDILLKGVNKAFADISVIKDANFEIRDGEFCVIVGPSGCGKSTLLRMIAGLEEISEGEIHIGGRCVNDLSPKDRGIAMVFQSYALYPHMTVFQNMAFGLKLASRSKAVIAQRVEDAAKKLQLDTLLDRRPSQLSGGQRQRVAIGRAIVREPEVFLFDEPLSNLDAALRVQTRVEIAHLQQELKATMVYVTHDQVEAMTLADKMVVLRDGTVQQVGAPLTLYHHPKNLFVASFIGSPAMNFIGGIVSNVDSDAISVLVQDQQTVRIEAETRDLGAGDAVTLGVRPEHLTIGEGNGLLLRGEVDVVQKLGDVSYVYVNIPSGESIIVNHAGTSSVTSGEKILVSASSEVVHLFNSAGLALVQKGE